jgi:hypothetical protein
VLHVVAVNRSDGCDVVDAGSADHGEWHGESEK